MHFFLMLALAWMTSAGWFSNIVTTLAGHKWPLVPGLYELTLNQKPVASLSPLFLSHCIFLTWCSFGLTTRGAKGVVFFAKRSQPAESDGPLQHQENGGSGDEESAGGKRKRKNRKQWSGASVRPHAVLSEEVKAYLTRTARRVYLGALAYGIGCTVLGVASNYVTFATVLRPWEKLGFVYLVLDTVITLSSYFVQFTTLSSVAAEFYIMATLHELVILQHSALAAAGHFGSAAEICIAHHSTVTSVQRNSQALSLVVSVSGMCITAAFVSTVGLYLYEPCPGCWLRFVYLSVITAPVFLTWLRASNINTALDRNARAICYLQSVAYAPQCLARRAGQPLLAMALSPDSSSPSTLTRIVLHSVQKSNPSGVESAQASLASIDWPTLFGYYNLWNANGKTGFTLFGVLITRSLVTRLSYFTLSSAIVLVTRAAHIWQF